MAHESGCGCNQCSSIAIPTGKTGRNGQDGIYGGYSAMWNFSATTGATPVSGQMQLDSSTLSSVALITYNKTSTDSVNMALMLASITGGFMRFYSEFDPTKFWLGRVVSLSIVDPYYRYTVEHVQSNGTFTALDRVVSTFNPPQLDSGWVNMVFEAGYRHFIPSAPPKARRIGNVIFLDNYLVIDSTQTASVTDPSAHTVTPDTTNKVSYGNGYENLLFKKTSAGISTNMPTAIGAITKAFTQNGFRADRFYRVTNCNGAGTPTSEQSVIFLSSYYNLFVTTAGLLVVNSVGDYEITSGIITLPGIVGTSPARKDICRVTTQEFVTDYRTAQSLKDSKTALTTTDYSHIPYTNGGVSYRYEDTIDGCFFDTSGGFYINLAGISFPAN